MVGELCRRSCAGGAVLEELCWRSCAGTGGGIGDIVRSKQSRTDAAGSQRYYTVLHCTALHCNVVHCTVLHCTTAL